MRKTCKQCQSAFDVTESDLAFYDKVSPVFAGKKYVIPPPTLCPVCRRQRRHAWRNERHLYKRKCDKTGKNIISIYPEGAPYTVYAHEEWWKDGWDPLAFEREYDASRPFFAQFKDLMQSVPRPSIHVLANENCEYVNQCGYSKDCYLSFNTDWCEECFYCKNTIRSKSSCDLLNAEHCELCVASVDLANCHGVAYSSNCKNTHDSLLCRDLIACSNCIGCSNLRNKQYCIWNEQLTKEEYETRKTALHTSSWSSFQDLLKRTRQEWLKHPYRALRQLECTDSEGDELRNCKNCRNCYDCFNAQDIAYCTVCSDCSDFRDFDIGGYQSDASMEVISSGYRDHHTLFGSNHWGSNSDTLYCELMVGNTHCFGCFGLRHKNYCILNKQYTKEEYETLVPKIIDRMKADGEFGEFFPAAMSPFPYNETVAGEYFPLTRTEVKKRGWQWREHTDEKPAVKKIIPAERLPDTTENTPDDVLEWAVTCQTSGRPFKILRKELEILRQRRLPLPRLHPDERYRLRLASRNSRTLWNRECMNCKKAIQTSFAPGRPEIVYCEECYLKTVY